MNEFKKKNKLEIITPSYNEGENIDIFISKFRKILELKKIDNYLITIVDDGSTIGNRNYYRKYSTNKDIRVIELSRNYGHQTAILAGLEYSIGDYILVIDIDLQDPVEIAIKLYEECLLKNLDLVKGIRKERIGESRFKIFSALVFYKIIFLLSDSKSISYESSGDFYCMNKRFKDALISNLPPRIYLRGQISQLGFDQGEIHYVRKPRKHGITKFSLLKMISFAYSGILVTTNKPLRIAGAIGSLGIILSLIIIFALSVYRIIYGTITPGWTFIVVSIYLCTSILLLCLSILSEYLALLIDANMTKKRYFIRSIK